MLRTAVKTGFRFATLPARLTYKSAKYAMSLPADAALLRDTLSLAATEAAKELQALADSVDKEMQDKAAHLTDEQREQATWLALQAAEQHLSMAARDLMRALWLASPASRKQLPQHDEHKSRPRLTDNS